jgi:hypothetical protein
MSERVSSEKNYSIVSVRVGTWVMANSFYKPSIVGVDFIYVVSEEDGETSSNSNRRNLNTHTIMLAYVAMSNLSLQQFLKH